MQKYVNKFCKKHGDYEFVLQPRGYYRCKKCRSEAVSNQRRRNKQKLVELFNSQCKICGYNKCIRALQFHHLDPSTKEYGLSESGICKSLEKMKKEAEKCILVCANCHAEIEHGLISIDKI